MFAVRLLVWSASCLISSATTANPFPTSPARAASIDALRARRFVWLEIAFIPSITSFICATTSCRLSISAFTSLDALIAEPDISFISLSFCSQLSISTTT